MPNSGFTHLRVVRARSQIAAQDASTLEAEAKAGGLVELRSIALFNGLDQSIAAHGRCRRDDAHARTPPVTSLAERNGCSPCSEASRIVLGARVVCRMRHAHLALDAHGG